MAVTLPSEADTAAARFEHFALTSPGSMAVMGEDGSLTYGALNALAERIASALARLPSPPDSPVGLMMGEGTYLVASMLGCIKAQRIFIPFEMVAPEAWLSQVIADSGISHILTDRRWQPVAERAAAGCTPIFEVDDFASNASGSMAPRAEISDAPALIIYTSGSTGKPKGVAVGHAALLHSPDVRAEMLRVEAHDRIGNLRPSATLAGMNNTLLALNTGACLYPLEIRNYGLQKLSTWLLTNKITGITFSGSLLRTWLSSLSEDRKFPLLRFIIATAEPFYGSDLTRLAPHLARDWRVMHSLASSEAGIVAVDIFDASSRVAPGPLPIGYPVPGIDVEIRREDGTLAAPGEVGEMVIRSRRSLAAGYWKDRGATDAAFGVDATDSTMRTYRSGDLAMRRSDGKLEHHGRKGRRLKIRGYTVEPFQVERALLCLPGVRDASVLVSEEPAAEARLIAYAVAPGLNGFVIREGIAKVLPPQMVPSDIVLMEEFPMTSRGKLDRKALPAPGIRKTASRPFRPPTDDYERSVAAIWQQILNVEKVGLDDDFYELGGTSLQAFSIFARIAAELKSDLPPTTMVNAPTVSKLAQIVRQKGQRIGQDAKLVSFRDGGSAAPLFVIHAAFGDIMFVRDLAKEMNGDRPVYGIQPPALNGKSELPRTIKGLAADYLAEIKKLQPKGPYHLAGYSFGGWVAFEMAQQARESGAEVAFLGIIDSNANAPERFAGRVFRHLAQIKPRSSFSYVGTRLKKTWAVAAKRAYERLQYAPNGLRLAFGRPLAYEDRTKFYNHVFRRAAAHYQMKPYDGYVVVFSNTSRTGAQTAFWKKFAKGGFTIHQFATDHYGIVLPPHSTELARHLDTHLAALTR
jgi:acyl-coenzyme A synthetase/AMP-(fatty) acid ligase/thioesterase domain-containing protein